MKKIIKCFTLLALLLLPTWALAIDFTPSAGDPSVVYLGYIFGTVNGVLSGSGSQILGKMFNVFNMSILMLGSLVAIYTTVMAVLNTGQDGEFLGKKWSSLFVPLRMLFGVLLIAPTTTGYSLIQVAVMWIVLQGVGAANYVWAEVMDYLQQGNSLFSTGTTGGSSAYNTVYPLMQTAAESVTCLEGLNLSLQKLTTSSEYSTGSYQAMPSMSPFYSVIQAINQTLNETPPTTTQGIPMPCYATACGATQQDATNWGFLNGICGELYFNSTSNAMQSVPASSTVYNMTGIQTTQYSNAQSAQTSASTGQTSSDGTLTNTVLLGLQQALLTIDAGIQPMVFNYCGAQCPTGYNCGSSQTYPYQFLVMSVPAGSTTCLTPTTNPLLNVTTGGVSTYFPWFYWNPYQLNGLSDVLANATNTYIGLASNYITGGSGLNTSSDWLQAGNYFFQLISYVGGSQSFNGNFSINNVTSNNYGYNGATWSFSWGGSYPGPSTPPNTNASAAWLGIMATVPSGSSTFTTNLLQNCNGGGSAGNCLPYTNVPSDAQDYLQGIMLPLVATQNIGMVQGSSCTTSASTPITTPNYVVGNFLSCQSYQNGIPAPMTAASSVASSSAGAGALSVLMGGAYTLYTDIQNLTADTGTANNPVIQMMTIGSDCINTGFSTWLITSVLSMTATMLMGAIPSVTMSQGLGTFFNAFMSLVLALAIPLIAAGGMLLYYFPMMPFMIYAFGVIGWFIGVIEGMVAAPVVGIGIMHPEGHDIFGKGDQALMLLLNMFLRPSLMVFGLITSIMLVYISVWIINSGINNTISAISGQATSFASTSSGMGYIAIPLVYTAIVFNVVGKCFSMITILPDKVTRWLSGGLQESLGSEMSGLADKVQGAASAGMSAYGQAIGKSGEGMQAAGLKGGEELSKSGGDGGAGAGGAG